MSHFDTTVKENLIICLPLLCQLFLHLDIRTLQELNPELPTTLKRKPDFLAHIQTTSSPQPLLLHIEFQTHNHSKMHIRMLEYLALLLKKYPTSPILQYVFYLGNKPLKMPNTLTTQNLHYHFPILDFRNFPASVFLNAPSPEQNLLAILANYQNQKAEAIIEQILHKIIQNPHLTPIDINKYVTQLEILALLRNLQPLVIQKATAMSIHIDIQKDTRYQQGREEGRIQGREEGKIQGREEGRIQGREEGKIEGALQEKINLARKLLQEGMSPDFILRVTQISPEQLQEIQKSQ